ncbi:NAD(P)/FAD-dependent oxidoreductase [Pseudarthrobacter phenanthrenivorans]|uniref:NAD(P)/FAD-dependent oxidoreductase n=1 Tax=Pseudarthrobacter phenanthrenivorans TaxID=361575 RepID=A0A3B0FLR8_PSEPS|nr:NAD(P)/FAD-dependent oxidoreductase [Pseudarthrobacter phenanthrenivorans]RKO20840.1 NAD(P)/FAD-dependent oxidoreductase [Pseudarthrobacter phenanthrenivorans]
MDRREQLFDVAIIGGGPAGLSAGVALARALRSVVVIDAGGQRNLKAEGVHGFLTREGMSPHALLEAGRRELAEFGGKAVTGYVNSGRREDGNFLLSLDDGSFRSARRLLITSGITDHLPDLPGVAERWGRDVLYCPYCHGWEIRNRNVGVLAADAHAVRQALTFRQWSPHVTLLLNGAVRLSPGEAEQLEARNVHVVEGKVRGLDIQHDRLAGVHFDDGSAVPLEVLVVSPATVSKADMLQAIGLEPDGLEEGPGSRLAADDSGQTSCPGVWAAGNATDVSAQVMTAAAAGLKAAEAINADLVLEDTRQAVERARAGTAPVPAP